MRLIAFLLLASASAACTALDYTSAGDVQNGAVPAACVAGEPIVPSAAFSTLRPQQTFTCRYRAAELDRRLRTLLDVAPRALSVADVEAALSIAELYTAFDDPRSRDASYDATIEASPGFGEWQVAVSFSETFRPPVNGRPARFRGGLRPTLIDRRNRGEIRLRITWYRPHVAQATPPDCLVIDEFVRAARRAGWRDRRLNISSTSHAGVFRRIEVSKAGAKASVDVTLDEACAYDFEIVRDQDKKEPPVTEEELRAN